MDIKNKILGESYSLLGNWAWAWSRSLYALIFSYINQEYWKKQNCNIWCWWNLLLK